MPYEVEQALHGIGRNIRMARIRRRLRQADLAKKLSLSRQVIARVEAGNPTTAIATYVAVLWALDLVRTVSSVAEPDQDSVGKTLEKLRLPEKAMRKRGPAA